MFFLIFPENLILFYNRVQISNIHKKNALHSLIPQQERSDVAQMQVCGRKHCSLCYMESKTNCTNFARKGQKTRFMIIIMNILTTFHWWAQVSSQSRKASCVCCNFILPVKLCKFWTAIDIPWQNNGLRRLKCTTQGHLVRLYIKKNRIKGGMTFW